MNFASFFKKGGRSRSSRRRGGTTKPTITPKLGTGIPTMNSTKFASMFKKGGRSRRRSRRGGGPGNNPLMNPRQSQ